MLKMPSDKKALQDMEIELILIKHRQEAPKGQTMNPQKEFIKIRFRIISLKIQSLHQKLN